MLRLVHSEIRIAKIDGQNNPYFSTYEKMPLWNIT
jgi:hypothetical protein